MKRLVIATTGMLSHHHDTAWTAVYVYWQDTKLKWLSHKIFHLGFDPTASSANHIEVFGSVLFREWRFDIPNPVPFRETLHHPDMLPVYKAFTSLQYGLDGRYGWLARWRKRKVSNVGQEVK